MNTERPFPRASVNEKAEKRLREGHPWVFGDDVTDSGGCTDGEICDVYSSRGKWLGAGFFNSVSKIRVRIISYNANDRFDDDFWRRRVKHAVDYRRSVMAEDFQCCRLIFGEADFFPGLTVDRFGSVLSVQCACLGIERIKDKLYTMIVGELRQGGDIITTLYERNDAHVRQLEGLENYTGYWTGADLEKSSGETVICENGIKYNVNYADGQKTGFFLDQKYNRLAIRRIAKGRRVLDCFTHTGAFALNAAAGGAVSVDAADVSADAVAMAKRNTELNGLGDKINFICTDVFDLLEGMLKEKRRDYDFIILDPPAFTKSSSTIKNALRGYREINTAAMRLLPRGGYLATCSCSHFMRETLFCSMLHDSAKDAGVRLRQIEARHQSFDHPILWSVPETDYLKFYIFQIV